MAQKALAQNRSRANYINDIDQLIAIADLLAKNPDLKRTTAIKAIGIKDPRTIRRLRSKLAPDKNSKNIPNTKKNRAPETEKDALDRNILALKNITQTKSKRKSSSRTSTQDKPPKIISSENKETRRDYLGSSSQEKPDILTCFFSANLAASQAMIQWQYKMMSYAFQASPLACYLRNQELVRLTLQNLKKP